MTLLLVKLFILALYYIDCQGSPQAEDAIFTKFGPRFRSNLRYLGPSELDTIEKSDSTSSYPDSSSTDTSTPNYLTTPTPSPSPAPCPAGDSLFTAKDIRTMFLDALNYYQANNIFEESFKNVTGIRDLLKTQIDEFMKFLKKEPQHLKHVLDDVKKRKEKLLPVMHSISLMFDKEYPILVNKFNNIMIKYSNLFKKYVTYDKIIKICHSHKETAANSENYYSSEEQEFMTRDQESYYCSSVEELNSKMYLAVSNYKRHSEEWVNEKFNSLKMFPKERMEELKKNLSEVALKKFGRTMYDILRLEDTFYHTEGDLEDWKKNSSHNIDVTKKVLSQLEQIVNSELPTIVKQYGDYSRKCIQEIESNDSLASPRGLSSRNVNSNLLTEVVNTESQVKFDEYEVHFQQIRTDMNAMLQVNTDDITDYYDEIRKEISNITDLEFKELAEVLEQLHITEKVKYLSKHKDNSENLLKEVSGLIEYIIRVLSEQREVPT